MKLRAEYRDKHGDWDFYETDIPEGSTDQDIRDHLEQHVGRWFGHHSIKVTVDGESFKY